MIQMMIWSLNQPSLSTLETNFAPLSPRKAHPTNSPNRKKAHLTNSIRKNMNLSLFADSVLG